MSWPFFFQSHPRLIFSSPGTCSSAIIFVFCNCSFFSFFDIFSYPALEQSFTDKSIICIFLQMHADYADRTVSFWCLVIWGLQKVQESAMDEIICRNESLQVKVPTNHYIIMFCTHWWVFLTIWGLHFLNCTHLLLSTMMPKLLDQEWIIGKKAERNEESGKRKCQKRASYPLSIPGSDYNLLKYLFSLCKSLWGRWKHKSPKKPKQNLVVFKVIGKSAKMARNLEKIFQIMQNNCTLMNLI